MQIAVINQSSLVNNIDVATMCQAIQIQLDQHVLPAWNMKFASINFYSDKLNIPNDAWLINVLDDSAEVGALGYHSEDNDKIDAFVFCKPILSNNGIILFDPTNPQNVSIASVLSHEVCEMIGDPFANLWADGPSILQGNEYAFELCDPVEGDLYEIDAGPIKVSVSNFVFPSWFNPDATSPSNLPFDYMNKLKAPFSMSQGGYMVVRKSEQSSQIFAESMPVWKQEIKKGIFSRNMRLRNS